MARSGDDVVRVKVVAGPFPATGRRRSKTTQRAGLRNARTPSGVYFVREAHNWTMRPGEKSGVRNGQSSCIGMGFYLRHWDCVGLGLDTFFALNTALTSVTCLSPHEADSGATCPWIYRSPTHQEKKLGHPS